jgi:hypothetical protein
LDSIPASRPRPISCSSHPPNASTPRPAALSKAQEEAGCHDCIIARSEGLIQRESSETRPWAACQTRCHSSAAHPYAAAYWRPAQPCPIKRCALARDPGGAARYGEPAARLRLRAALQTGAILCEPGDRPDVSIGPAHRARCFLTSAPLTTPSASGP